ncbi:flagellar hook-length control protein FliK [Microbulbifer magnicolonia]|uniref:flagellar hook-length control protein FliK n=1 Tax=Microbulbifer magnicolonia TaxID=3109744 RepID=UPI002B412C2D|nr:flagellar hook-length control protein FliK [Microbulbifer sp. GG15]
MDITALLAGLPPGTGNGARGIGAASAAEGKSFALALQAADGKSKAATTDLLAEILPATTGEKSAAPDSAPDEIASEDGASEGGAAEVNIAFALSLSAAPSPQNSFAPVPGEGADAASSRVPLPAAVPVARSEPELSLQRDPAEAAAPRIPTAQAGAAAAQAAIPVTSSSGAENLLPELARTEGAAVPVSPAAEAASPGTASATAAAPVSTPGSLPSPAAPPAPAVSPSLQAPLASQPWGLELGQQLVGLAQRGDDHVELQLNPRELGPLSVSLTVDDQGARAQFFSTQAAVRGAVEQAIPQLRDALAQQGIALGEATVGDQQQQQRAPTARDFAGGNPPADGESAPDTATTARMTAASADRIGGVDLYA